MNKPLLQGQYMDIHDIFKKYFFYSTPHPSTGPKMFNGIKHFLPLYIIINYFKDNIWGGGNFPQKSAQIPKRIKL
jgi:hypothetical protein